MAEQSIGSSSPVAPHAPLAQHYANEGERSRYVNTLFEEAAPHYERIDRMMSLGSGEAYRRVALRRGGLRAGMRLLDIASGTGLVLRPGASIVGPTGLSIGLDPSAAMLRQSRAALPLPLVQSRGECLPFASCAFDFVSLGYGLRHVPDLNQLFRECFRVLRPRGRLLVLEFARPESRVGRMLGRLYLKRFVPMITRLVTRHEGAEKVMRYCWDTVDQVVSGEAVKESEVAAGFSEVARCSVLGVFCEYSATKP